MQIVDFNTHPMYFESHSSLVSEDKYAGCKYNFPKKFKSSDDYLSYLVWKAEPTKYEEVTPLIKERIELELSTIKEKEAANYMLVA